MIRTYCDRCQDEIFSLPTVRMTGPFGEEIARICEECSVAVRVWVENRPYSLLPDGRLSVEESSR